MKEEKLTSFCCCSY